MFKKFAVLCLTLLLSNNLLSKEDFSEQCEVEVGGEPIAFWDFNKDRRFPLKNGIIEFNNRHGGIVNVPETNYYGVEFKFSGKWPDGDSSSELRYKIIEPQEHIFEYLKIYQPKNFYHRMIIEVQLASSINPDKWQDGDRVVSDNGHYAKVAKAFKNKLYIKAPDIIYKKAWGKGRIIRNTENNVELISLDSKIMGFNNKLSAMWQGEYSNGGMIVGTTSVAFASGGEEGNGYCETLVSKSHDHGTKGTQGNTLGLKQKPLCFDVIDNGKIVEFVLERKRATNLENPDGIYSIWRRTEDQPWEHIYFNNKITAFQHEKNYFDNGYIFGWSNSGYKEDTSFFLLSWGLWNKKPNFL